MEHRWRAGRSASGVALALMALALLAGCYTSRTALVDGANAVALAGIRAGVYCHMELGAEQVVDAAAEVSAALGDNRCRDLSFDPGSGRYVDARSPSMVFRVGDLGETLLLLQVQTGETAPARYSPLVAVDGVFVQFDPAGRWPEDLVAAHGLALEADGGLPEVDADRLSALLKAVLARVLDDFRRDLAVIPGGAGLRFAEGSGLSYLVWMHDDLRGHPEALGRAVAMLGERLGLRR